MEQQRKNRLRNFIIAYTAVFVVLGIFGVLYADRMQITGQAQNPSGAQKLLTDLAYWDLPRITVSMNARNGEASPRLRADLSLEVARKDSAVLEGYQPRISESLSRILSNTTPDQLQRDGALPKLRADMLRAINDSGTPVPVHDLLFRQLVIM